MRSGNVEAKHVLRDREPECREDANLTFLDSSARVRRTATWWGDEPLAACANAWGVCAEATAAGAAGAAERCADGAAWTTTTRRLTTRRVTSCRQAQVAHDQSHRRTLVSQIATSHDGHMMMMIMWPAHLRYTSEDN